MAPALFTPLRVGDITVQHRVALAPLTRFRAHDDHVHSDMAIEYYGQRAANPRGTLLITEATFISEAAGGFANVPGIYSPEQVKAWKKIVDEVHAKGSYIFLQLWFLGRAATAAVLKKEPSSPDVVSSGDIPLPPTPLARSTDKPRPMTEQEIHGFIKAYADAARAFVKEAGGDGVEIHGANGYAIDQFTQNTCNNRTDKWGGSVENRCRFAREVVSAVAAAVGPTKTAIRLSPHSEFQGMKMAPADLKETFTFLVSALAKDHPKLAYLHLTLPRVSGVIDHADKGEEESIDFLADIWSPRPLILAGGYTPELALSDAEKYKNSLVAFGRYYIANPDLPTRIEKGIPFTKYNRKTFYSPGPEGYTSYKPATESRL